MSKLLTICITPKTTEKTTHTETWEQRNTLRWKTFTTNALADRLRQEIMDEMPDSWHVENDESDEWEFGEEDMPAFFRMTQEYEELPPLPDGLPEGCGLPETVSLTMN